MQLHSFLEWEVKQKDYSFSFSSSSSSSLPDTLSSGTLNFLHLANFFKSLSSFSATLVALSLWQIIYFSVDMKVSESHVLMSAPWARGQQSSSRRDIFLAVIWMPNTADTTEVVVICTLSSGALLAHLSSFFRFHFAIPRVLSSLTSARAFTLTTSEMSLRKSGPRSGSLWQRESKRCERLRRKWPRLYNVQCTSRYHYI